MRSCAHHVPRARTGPGPRGDNSRCPGNSRSRNAVPAGAPRPPSSGRTTCPARAGTAPPRRCGPGGRPGTSPVAAASSAPGGAGTQASARANCRSPGTYAGRSRTWPPGRPLSLRRHAPCGRRHRPAGPSHAPGGCSCGACGRNRPGSRRSRASAPDSASGTARRSAAASPKRTHRPRLPHGS